MLLKGRLKTLEHLVENISDIFARFFLCLCVYYCFIFNYLLLLFQALCDLALSKLVYQINHSDVLAFWHIILVRHLSFS